MSDSKQPNGSNPQDLCLACGLCCNGVLFADVKLQAEDNHAVFAALLAPPSRNPAGFHSERQWVPSSAARGSFIIKKKGYEVLQPCVAFDGCRCRIYSERPHYCREFECLLLRNVRKGRTSKVGALEIIRSARELADKVWHLLRELGDVDEDRTLSVRFRHTARRLERSQLDKHTAKVFGELTVAVHNLNCLLSSSFYPG